MEPKIQRRSRPRSGGRQPKGNRIQTTVSLEAEIYERILDVSEAEGLPLTDIVTRLCAEGLGLAVPAYCRPKPQEELPLDKAS